MADGRAGRSGRGGGGRGRTAEGERESAGRITSCTRRECAHLWEADKEAAVVEALDDEVGDRRWGCLRGVWHREGLRGRWRGEYGALCERSLALELLERVGEREGRGWGLVGDGRSDDERRSRDGRGRGCLHGRESWLQIWLGHCSAWSAQRST